MTRRLALVIVSLLALSACRLDISVDVVMEPDGTGIVTVDAVADAELMAQVPGLIDDLRLEDAIENGWTVAGPVKAADGGASITLTHGFTSHVELANVLNSIGPPFTNMAAARTTAEDQTTNAIDGDLVLTNGFESFADSDLIQTVGGLPFSDEFEAMATTPPESMSVIFRVSLPGELISAETGTEVEEGVIEWNAPLDGSSVNVYTATVQRPEGAGASWAEPLSNIALVALIVWVVIAVAFIGFVAIARARKRRRRHQALRDLG